MGAIQIQFGQAEIKGTIVHEWVFDPPVFGPLCVCCGVDAGRRTQDFHPDTGKIHSRSVPMPVCPACRDHAFVPETAAALVAMLFFAGVVATALGSYYKLWPVAAAGVAAVAVAVALLVRAHRRERRLRATGHHPGVRFAVVGSATHIVTTREELADDLLARNPIARRIRSRREHAQEPETRMIGGVATPAAKEDQAELVAQKIVAGTPADLELVRALLATGTVNHVLVEGHLAEVQQLLGRSDLIPRYRALREAAPPA